MANKTLSADFLQASLREFESDRRFELAQNVLTQLDPRDVLLKRNAMPRQTHDFSVRLSREFKATSQKASGRCWIFACLNVMRHAMLKKYPKLPDNFELSQTYVFFYDKLERCNYFLERILDTYDEPLGGRLVQHILSSPLNDGGQFSMLKNVISKYGIVPRSSYPEAWSSTASRTFNRCLTAKLREWAAVLREACVSKGVSEARALKAPMLKEAHRILLVHFGTPPQVFDWTYTDKDKKNHRVDGLTPRIFLEEHVPFTISTKISLINDPRNEYYQTYTVDKLGNCASILNRRLHA